MELITGTADELQNQIWNATVVVFVDHAEGLPLSNKSDDDDDDDDDEVNDSNHSKPSEAFIRLRLGNEKWISKRSRNHRWLESFDFHLFDVDQQLEVAVWHLRQMYAVTTIDLELLQRERIHRVWVEFADAGKSARILLIIQISEVNVVESIRDYTTVDDWKERDLKLRYDWRQTFHNFKDVGHLTVIVYEAMGLAEAAAAATIGTFCVVQLGSSRLQTQIEAATIATTATARSPRWNKIFTLHVKDMTSVLELFACSKDSQEIVVLGTMAIPLLRIKYGIKRWFALRACKSTGAVPMILLEMSLVWNPLRALGNIFQPKQREHPPPPWWSDRRQQQQKQQLFVQNVHRIQTFCDEIERIHNCIQNLFEWKSPLRTLIALIFWVASCVYVKSADIPSYLAFIWLTWGCLLRRTNDKMAATTHDLCQLDSSKDSGYQEALDTVGRAVARLQMLATRIQNIFNFTIPTLTWLAGFMLVFAVFLLCLVPIRWMLLAWGTFKFTKRIVRPKAVIDSSLMNFLFRVPDNSEVEKYRELPT